MCSRNSDKVSHARHGAAKWPLLLLVLSLSAHGACAGLLYRHMVERNALVAYQRAQVALDARWQHDPKLLCATSQVFGPVNKTAAINEMPWVLYRKATRRALPEAVPIYARPSMYISHKYRLLYVRQQKSSSSSIIAALQALLCENPRNCTRQEFGHADTGISNEVWHSYYVFTWVRNPWMRMISSYNMICSKFLRLRDPGTDSPGAPCCVPFDRFAQDPYTLIQTCADDRCCLWNDGQWDDHFIAGHINDQTHTVFTTDRRSLVDFIGRTEHMESDWAALVQHINRHAGTAFPPPELPQINPSEMVSASGVVTCGGRELPVIAESDLHAIAKQFAMDIVRFGYIGPATALERDPSLAPRLLQRLRLRYRRRAVLH